MKPDNKNIKICVVGLGYVGLPLATALAKHYPVIGYDINKNKIEELKRGLDSNGETEKNLIINENIDYTFDPKKISSASFIIITVPTPVDEFKQPDLTPIIKACQTIGENLSSGSIVVLESTVYPGVTEEVCVPILEKTSGLKYKKDFNVGYSPERINPGDKIHTIDKVVKVVSGDTPKTLAITAQVYGSITKIFKAKSIKAAEAAKVIENTQRDLNIALMNELKIIFDKMNLDIIDVLEAAKTKWNFLPFYPGLVGGHCIGVDPYYLAEKAKSIGIHPQLILAGRRINDSMASYHATKVIRLMINKNINIKKAKVLILGATFKPDVKDFRNSKVKDLADELRDYGCGVKFFEPMVDKKEIWGYENIKKNKIKSKVCDLVIKAVNHKKIGKIQFDYEI
jgi:UDP-N-acetyl-D-glucosamine/UDP-N-acetyl-D-galactosamine dehydrogenase